ncbi:MAG TPA: hypothetical protein VGS97_07880 [Actinocrinis sp.]|uniref:hypothetical protein n=1 Tax=Actinocrinis sp. TaxID=1920516 RepID=UPI002DDD3ADD|nr:hypothetical protein [Actinocrinis sp.]HEV2343996.1 hypothetical protein [Actinocrinis sp.]
MHTVFFAADAALLPRLAAAGGDLDGLDLACVDAADLDPAQLLELDTLMTGHDPVAVREAVLTPARELGRPGALAQGTEERVVLCVRPALCTSLLGRTDAELDGIAEDWELRGWGADWGAHRYGALLRSLALLAEVANIEQHGVYVRFDV